MSKRKLICWLLVLVVLVPCVVFFAWQVMHGRRYTATACLLLATREPHILPNTAEKFDPVEFEVFRDTQSSLIKNEKVITAALREPGLNKLYCIQQADERHDAIQWLTDAIHVECPAKNGGVVYVSATNGTVMEHKTTGAAANGHHLL